MRISLELRPTLRPAHVDGINPTRAPAWAIDNTIRRLARYGWRRVLPRRPLPGVLALSARGTVAVRRRTETAPSRGFRASLRGPETLARDDGREHERLCEHASFAMAPQHLRRRSSDERHCRPSPEPAGLAEPWPSSRVNHSMTASASRKVPPQGIESGITSSHRGAGCPSCRRGCPCPTPQTPGPVARRLTR
jgi:hypothetical protein